MRPEDRRKHSRPFRLPLAAVLVLSLLAGTNAAQARPSHADLVSARAKLHALNDRESSLVEQYDQAQVALAQTQHKLDSAKAAMTQADAQAQAANRELSRRAGLAYMGVGSEIDTIFGANNLSDLSDRLEFLNQIAGSDESVVTTARVSGQRAAWARADLQKAVAERRTILTRIAQNKSQLLSAIGQQKSLIDKIQKALQRPVYVPQPPQAPAPVQQLGPAPPINGTGAAAAVSAAYSVIGTPYVYAGSSPSQGFDCSGLTMWAWAHGGVSLPHSSSMQYDAVPHVSKSDLQPGDLLFFYNPIHHVAIYVGGGMMIEAPHTGAYVQKVPIYWSEFVGAGRP